ncbi:MAG: phosphate ABC transporter permease subunit PstC [Planctomycetota bacterium]
MSSQAQNDTSGPPAKDRFSFVRSIGRTLDICEPAIQLAIRACGWSSIVLVAAIFFFIFLEAGDMVYKLDWGEFFFSTRWIPSPAEGNEPVYGAGALLVGTIAVTIGSMLISVPLGLGAAVYISEFASPRVKETLKVIIEQLAAIPSVVWGFIGIAVMGPLLIQVTGYPVGINLFNGSLVVGLMAVPLIVSISEDALRSVPDSYREAAMALGASKWEMVYKVLFPSARNGLLAACMLGVGRAVGETMAVLMATGNANKIPSSIFDSVQTMTATIAQEMGDAVQGGEHYQVLFVIGIVLLVITCAINVVSDIVIKGLRKEKNA